MDPQVLELLSSLDAAINNLSLNPAIDPGELKTLQSRRTGLDKRLISFKEELERRNKQFAITLKSEIDGIFRKITEITS